MIAQPDSDSKPAATKREFLTCYSTMGCPELDLAGVIELAQRHDIDCLELRSLENTTDLPSYFAASQGGSAAARGLLEAASKPARVLGTSFKLVGDNQAGRDALLAFARLAEELGTPYLRIFGGGAWGKPLVEADFQNAVEVLEWWNAERTANGWRTDMLIETHDAFSATPPLLELFDRLGRGTGIIWDSHHTWRLGGESPAETWTALRPHIKHVHIKDSTGLPSARHPYTYVIPGTGEMPLREVMSVLRRDGYDGAVSVEWEKMWHPYLPDLSEALGAASVQGWW